MIFQFAMYSLPENNVSNSELEFLWLISGTPGISWGFYGNFSWYTNSMVTTRLRLWSDPLSQGRLGHGINRNKKSVDGAPCRDVNVDL